MTNYYDFKKITLGKLNNILEEKITKLSDVKPVRGYSAKVGHYTVSPFGVNTYIISVVLPSKEVADNFYTEYYKDSSLEPGVFEDSRWKLDKVYGWYGVDIYVNSNRVEEAESEVKKLLDKLI